MTSHSITQLKAFGITEDDVRSATQTLAKHNPTTMNGSERVNCLIVQDDVPVSKATKIVTYIARSNPLCQ